MSTRSMIGIDEPEGGRFIYCHFDGYPTGVGNALRAIIDRDGAEKAIATILEQGAQGGWSVLDPDKGGEREEFDSGDAVAGYGVAYRDAPDAEPCTLWGALTDSWIEYVYEIDPAGGISIYQTQREYGVWTWYLRPGESAMDDERPKKSYRVAITNRGDFDAEGEEAEA